MALWHFWLAFGSEWTHIGLWNSGKSFGIKGVFGFPEGVGLLRAFGLGIEALPKRSLIVCSVWYVRLYLLCLDGVALTLWKSHLIKLWKYLHKLQGLREESCQTTARAPSKVRTMRTQWESKRLAPGSRVTTISGERNLLPRSCEISDVNTGFTPFVATATPVLLRGIGIERSLHAWF